MTPEDARKLREPFPPELVGKLPKAGITLDYVGHAAVTDRLLQVDPAWTWEYAPEYPAYDGGMWIKLTVCGVTRPGFGDGKNPKEWISDAIRNAAMRFGVALDLWSKQPLTDESTGAPDRAPTERMANEADVRDIIARLEGLLPNPGYPPDWIAAKLPNMTTLKRVLAGELSMTLAQSIEATTILDAIQ